MHYTLLKSSQFQTLSVDSSELRTQLRTQLRSQHLLKQVPENKDKFIFSLQD